MRQCSPLTKRQRHIYRFHFSISQPGHQICRRGLGDLEFLGRENPGFRGDVEDRIVRGNRYFPFGGNGSIDAASFIGCNVLPCGIHFGCGWYCYVLGIWLGQGHLLGEQPGKGDPSYTSILSPGT